MSRHDAFFRTLFRDYDAITLAAHGRIAAQEKADGSSVTAVDREASSLALSRIKLHTPDHGIISEEEVDPYLPLAKRRWVMDPLDGTAAFARGLPIWGIGVGLIEHDQPREGYLRFPVVNETYAFRDGEALSNDQPITASAIAIAPDCRNLMITSIHRYIDVRRIDGYRLHNLGSNLYHMMALATGRCEAIITGPCYLWDLAPALPFTRALGYVERFVDGSPLEISQLLSRSDFGFAIAQPLVVGSASIVASLIDMIAPTAASP